MNDKKEIIIGGERRKNIVVTSVVVVILVGVGFYYFFPASSGNSPENNGGVDVAVSDSNGASSSDTVISQMVDQSTDFASNNAPTSVKKNPRGTIATSAPKKTAQNKNSISLPIASDTNINATSVISPQNNFDDPEIISPSLSLPSSSSPVLLPDHHYQWLFELWDAGPSVRAGVQFYGVATDTAGGPFLDPSIANAKFVVNGTSGVLFAN